MRKIPNKENGFHRQKSRTCPHRAYRSKYMTEKLRLKQIFTKLLFFPAVLVHNENHVFRIIYLLNAYLRKQRQNNIDCTFSIWRVYACMFSNFNTLSMRHLILRKHFASSCSSTEYKYTCIYIQYCAFCNCNIIGILRMSLHIHRKKMTACLVWPSALTCVHFSNKTSNLVTYCTKFVTYTDIDHTNFQKWLW